MNDKLLTTDNAKFAIASVLSLIAIGVVYKAAKTASKAYQAVDNAVDSVIDPIADTFFEWRLGDGVELPEFNVSRLYRDYFDDEWVMKSEPLALITKAYPSELRSILDEDNKLYEQYRSQVGE